MGNVASHIELLPGHTLGLLHGAADRFRGASPGVRLAVTSAALVFALRVVIAFKGKGKKPSKSRLVKDAAKVGQRVGSQEKAEYDVVIIGGGTAGCVLAARLSEDPSLKVLLLEAGGSSLDNPFATIPSAASRLFKDLKHSWLVSTIPQENAGGWSRYWPRAKLLGGCTTINAMIFHYGAPSDYDKWAELQKGQEGADAWSYKEFHPYFLKFEKFHPDPRYSVDTSHHGSSGPVHIGYFSHTSAGSGKFLDACAAVGISRVADFNTPSGTLGAGKAMTYMNKDGRRVTAELAYLTPEVLARPNLQVATRAHVSRILFNNSAGGPLATGVEFLNASGERFQIHARKEVVISAGAVNTPHILMLSGVGPAAELKRHDIPIVADLPGVGSQLMDHLVLNLNFRDKTKSGVGYLIPKNLGQTIKLLTALVQYRLTGRGPLTTNIAESLAFCRSNDPKLLSSENTPATEIHQDNTTGPNAPDIELYYTPMAYIDHGQTPFPPGDYFALHAVCLQPMSSGKIALKSSNPLDIPVIDPAYLTNRNDMLTLMRAARLLGRLAHTEPLASMIDHAGDSDEHTDHGILKLSDTELEEYVRRKADTLYHPTSTARMAPLEDGGVVDPFLRVHGIPNLRVADASVFPIIVSGHTAAPTLAVAEKAAELIKAAHSSR